MLKLNQLYFRNFFLLFFATAVIISISGYYLLDKIEIRNHKTMLENMIKQFESTYKYIPNIDFVIRKIHQDTDIRITIIDFNGKVKYESNRDKNGMDNHIDRPEIKLSTHQTFASSIRHSDTLKKDLLYVAKKGKEFYIRMAYPLKSIKDKFLKFWIYAIMMFSSAMLIAFWIALKISKKVADDLDDIKEGLAGIIDKKYSMIFDDKKCCLEFDTISKQINLVSKKLKKRDHQKSKFTRKLKELNKQQGDIISAISHEFKNPITAILGYTQSVREDENLSKDIKDKFLDKVMKNAKKISYMIDRLSMAIKLENDSFVPNLSVFDLASILYDAKDILLQKYRDRNIIIDVKSVKIKADAVMFENLLINLIENGLKYSEDDILVVLKDDILRVEDRGIGINEEDIQNLTKRFFRVEKLSWDNSIGVGLYLVKYILKFHNTTLHVESKPGLGSAFSFSIKNLLV